MVKTDLITGFLGCGKTTFIRRYAEYLMNKGLKIRIIENEFGGVNVDSLMLRDESCEISEISGGCMCCTAKAALQNMLLDLAAEGYDRILIEPSGIYDVDEFFDIMLTEPVRSVCEIGSIIAIADAQFQPALSDESRYLMFSQLLSAGALVISKTQLFPRETVIRTLESIDGLMQEYGCDRSFRQDACTVPWDELTDGDLASFEQCGFRLLEHNRSFFPHGSAFTARAMAHLCAGPEDLEERLRRLMGDPASYGKILRIKGHIADVDRNWYEINCSLDGQLSIKPVDLRRGLFIVIGQDLHEEAIHGAFISRRKQ